MSSEIVVLVDEQNRVLGTIPKSEAHRETTPLHRAFSTYIFRSRDKQLLIQQRSSKKKTWPLIWSNTCCGHPGLDESNVDAARRRLKHELDLQPTFLEEVAPYRYCVTKDGIMENEICPILVGVVEHEPAPHPDEVEAVQWIEWYSFLEHIKHNPTLFSEWCIEQAGILESKTRWKTLIGI